MLEESEETKELDLKSGFSEVGPDPESKRDRDAGRISLPAGQMQTRIYKKDVRKVYCRVYSGQVQVTVRSVRHGNDLAVRTYQPTEYGGPSGGNGVSDWGEVVVEYKAIQDSDFYYHVEWS